MMKKLFALMLALCLVLCSAALAENEISWDQVEPLLTENGINGEFVTFEQIAVKVWIPEGMTAVEDMPENYIGYFAAEDGDAVAVMYANAEGMDLETYAQFVAENGGANIETGTVNGLPCVTYEVPANNSMNIAFTTEAGYILEAVVAPVTDDNSKLAGSIILASIQAVPQE